MVVVDRFASGNAAEQWHPSALEVWGTNPLHWELSVEPAWTPRLLDHGPVINEDAT
jgi:hypothetical protein